MKWYFAMNEAATTNGVGLHARIAVESARVAGGLDAVMLYHGARNDLTRWMEARGVRVVDAAPSFAPAIRSEAAAGRYPLAHMGHWLRTCIPAIEREAAFVLYTDCDVVFLRRPALDAVRPPHLASAPEFQPDDERYFNSGVMVMNVPALRADYPAFEAFVTEAIWAADGREFLDQNAYNAFYHRRWTRLAPRFNWKAYWPPSDHAEILHFHGPKIDVALGLMRGAIDWDNAHWRQLASLLAGSLPHYVAHWRLVLDLLPEMDPHARQLLEACLAEAPAFAGRTADAPVDLAFTQAR